MPIVAAHIIDDVRASAQMLAKTASECLNQPALAIDREIPLNNVYELMEAFRSEYFFGIEQSPRSDLDSSGRTFVPESHISDVRFALENGLTVAYQGKQKDEAISEIEDALRGLVDPTFQPPSEQNRITVKQFFDEVAKHLSAV